MFKGLIIKWLGVTAVASCLLIWLLVSRTRNSPGEWRVYVDGDLIRELLQDSDALYAVTFSGRLLALNAATGHYKWKTITPDDSTDGVFLVSPNKVLVVSKNSGLVGVDSTTGQTLWKYKCGKDEFVLGSPDNRKLYICGRTTLSAIDATTGNILSRRNVPAVSLNGAALAAGVVVLAVTGSDPRLVGFSCGSLKELWSVNEPSEVVCSIVGGNVLVRHKGRDIASVIATTGIRLWTQASLQKPWRDEASYASGPGGAIVGAVRRGDVFAVSASDGSVLWSTLTEDHIGDGPYIHNSRVYVGAEIGTVYSIGLLDGKSVSCNNLATIADQFSVTNRVTVTCVTAMVFGKDGALYVGTSFGAIIRVPP